MRIVAVAARVLLGLLFTMFGLNGFLHFLHQPPPPAGLAGQYLGALAGSHMFVVIFLCQLVGGVLLLSSYFTPLALAILAPVIVNILLYHITMDPPGIGPGLVVAVLWAIVFFAYRGAFATLFQPKAPIAGASA